ncbi:FimB/Mfa2 family fimbrial subunit [Bacteroides thetaiotaomicron]|uniref:FimB/Mfa2 family fimbrial subunit n=1 Tax=Bacteroides thetaiotaomicron TaxID=818 RepID=UPI0034A42BD6
MKYSKLTYYLLAILCMMATSCVSDGVMGECPDSNKNLEMVTDARVKLVLNFAINSSVTRAGETDGNTTEGEMNERKIKDVHIYAFQENKFKEKVQYVSIFGTDGESTRTIQGRLSESYLNNKAVKFIVVVNGESKGVTAPTLIKDLSTPDNLYNQLVFDYPATDNWSSYIPMSGECEISPLQEGDYNTAKLSLTRAIAKVNVTVNEGHGLDNFRITEIKLCNYNTKGYCTSSKINEPNIPNGTPQSKSSISSGTLTGTEGNAYENHFYIPEHKNIGVSNEKQVYLEIEAIVKNQSKSYKLTFTHDNKTHDVLRNYMYVFNIQSVKMDIDTEASLIYEVEKWEDVAIDVPGFGKE